MTFWALNIVEKCARISEKRGGLLGWVVAVVGLVEGCGFSFSGGFERGLLGGREGVDGSKGRTVLAMATLTHGLF